ncbi:MAG: PilZ domain-containing protein [Candidatus Kaelpia imicola]|nr:PilZ domain-containing protein [Candidatus Kaelpia imicola]
MVIKNRRKYFRLEVGAKVNVYSEEKSKSIREDKISATVKSISAGGVCFSSGTKFTLGNIIKLEVLLPDENMPFCLRGEVIWSNPVDSGDRYDTGVKMLSMGEGDEQKFIKYICAKMSERLSKYLHF